MTIRLWDLETKRCLRVFEGHTEGVRSLALSPNQNYVVSASDDTDVRLWNVKTGYCQNVFAGHTGRVLSVVWASDRYVVSGSEDGTARVWDVNNGRCLCILRGHVDGIKTVAWCSESHRVFTCDYRGGICKWDISVYISDVQDTHISAPDVSLALDQVQYTNAKILLVGDTSSGKTGLAHRLATGKWKPSDGSTVGAWSTQWPLLGVDSTKELDREIWLWDFGGQADQRLVHQLYMDRTAMILLLFDADREDVLPGLRDWQTALRRCVPESTPRLLIAGRIDTGFRASREKLKRFADEQAFTYFETSALDGTGCDDLVKAITESIPWEQMEQRTSPRIFKLIKDHILKLRDKGQVLHTFKELRDLLWQRMADEPRFSDDILKTVIGLLDGPGAVRELEYGTYILLQPEWINVYAQAVIRTLRQEPSELGCLPLRSIAEGKLLFQSVERDGSILDMKRLPEAEERVVLREMERQMEERGLCLRQGDKLVFPSHCGRERPEVVAHPSVFISYMVKG
jgi:small GTP-binding protein